MLRFQISKLDVIKFIILSIHKKSGNLKQSFFIAIILVLERLNIFIMPISDVSSWKTYFLKTPKLEFSNSLLKEIRQSVDPSLPFFDSVKEISKNDGITFLSLDPSEDRLQLFHHTTVIGGSWNSKEEKIVAIHGFDRGSIAMKKFLAKGKLEERKIVLGWEIDTRSLHSFSPSRQIHQMETRSGKTPISQTCQ